MTPYYQDMKHHPKFCPQDNMKVIYESWMLKMTKCRDCPHRIIELKDSWRTRILTIYFGKPLLFFWIRKKAEKVFGEKISWYAAGDF